MQNVTNLDEYLARYASQLGRNAQQALTPLHNPDTEPPQVARLLREPFVPQAHVITGCVKALRRQKAVLLVAEMGTGKTLMGMAACHTHAAGKPYVGLVVSPGQLTKKWERELRLTIPGVEVHQVESWRDCFKIKRKPARATWWIIGRDRCKLGSFWEMAVLNRQGAAVCPDCGHYLLDKDGARIPFASIKKARLRCDACGTPLWTFVRRWGAQDRWAPSSVIKKKRRGCIDYLVLDEVHELKGSDSAQANAMGELASVSRKVVALTGTLTGGSAEHLRPLLFRLQPASLVAEGFRFNSGITEFNERYGRIETRETESEPIGTENAMSRGSSRSTNKIPRPGIMPTLFGQHLIGNCVFLSLQEVADKLPQLVEQTIGVEMDDEIASEYRRIESVIRATIQSLGPNDKRLLGPMVNALLCYPDHQMNWDPIGYRERSGNFVQVVQPANRFPEGMLAKERALVDLAMSEFTKGRKLWVYVQYTDRHDVAGRLQHLLQAQGLRTEVMRASVKGEDREAWIAEHGPTADVVISHPDLVKTGLDFFDHEGRYNFPSLAFYETGYNLFTLRQAARRAWRIGQERTCKVFYLYYAGSMQERAVELMGKKMAAALAVEGQFSSEGLTAMNEDEGLEMALAKSLVENMDDVDAGRAWKSVEEATQAETVGDTETAIDVDALFAELLAV